MLKIFLFISSLLVLRSASLEIGECPDFTPVDPFDVAAYLGRWYEAERFEHAFERDMECVTADYGYVSDTMITVTNSAVVGNQTTQIFGNASTTDVPGSLIVEFPGYGVGAYNVLDTDYETYSCVYACAQVGEYKQEFGWVLSRPVVPDGDTLSQAEQVFASYDIDITKFRITQQGSDCYYQPIPPPPKH